MLYFISSAGNLSPLWVVNELGGLIWRKTRINGWFNPVKALFWYKPSSLAYYCPDSVYQTPYLAIGESKPFSSSTTTSLGFKLQIIWRRFCHVMVGRFFRFFWFGNKKHMLTSQFVWVSSLKFIYSSFASRCSSSCYAYLPEWWRGLAVTRVHSNDIYSALSHFLLLLLLSGGCRRHLAARGPVPPSTCNNWVNWFGPRTRLTWSRRLYRTRICSCFVATTTFFCFGFPAHFFIPAVFDRFKPFWGVRTCFVVNKSENILLLANFGLSKFKARRSLSN